MTDATDLESITRHGVVWHRTGLSLFDWFLYRTLMPPSTEMYGMPLVLLFRNYRYLQIFEDISNSFTDICNSFADILTYLQISLNI